MINMDQMQIEEGVNIILSQVPGLTSDAAALHYLNAEGDIIHAIMNAACEVDDDAFLRVMNERHPDEGESQSGSAYTELYQSDDEYGNESHDEYGNESHDEEEIDVYEVDELGIKMPYYSQCLSELF
jgi:hypothetical protein